MPKKTKTKVGKPVAKTKKKKSRKPTILWAKLKMEFFRSDQQFVVPFLIEKGIVEKGKKLTGIMNEKTAGWRKEKLAILEVQTEELKQAMRDQWQPYVQELILDFQDAKKLTLNAIQERLMNHAEKGPFGYFLKISDLKDILQMIKTELGEPTSISKSSVFNANLDLNQLTEMAEKSNKPIDPYENDREVYGDPEDLPTITIDGHEQ